MRWMLLPLVLAGCGTKPGQDPTTTDPDLPVVLALPAVVTPGGVLYAKLNPTLPPGEVTAFLGDRPLTELARSERVALFEVPIDQALGATTVKVRTLPGSRSEAIEVVAPWFRDVADLVGLNTAHDASSWSPDCAESLVGLGLVDADLDGDLDLFTTNLSAPSVFWENLGPDEAGGLPHFEDATSAFGLDGQDLAVGVAFADADGDGDRDLFLGRRGPNRLLENRQLPDGAGFVDATVAWGLPATDQRTTAGAWGDYDGDGDLDLVEVNHAWCLPAEEVQEHQNADHLYRNDGGLLVERTELLPDGNGGVSRRFGFAGLWIDADRDQDLDLIVVNDLVPHGGPTSVFRNDGPAAPGDWSFAHVTSGSGIVPMPDAMGKGFNAMAADVGDLNGDGLPDLALSNIGPRALSISQGDLVWVDEARERGVQGFDTPWETHSVTWGVHLFDLDNDMDLDLLFVGGAIKNADPIQPHVLYENLGDGTFVDRTWQAGLSSTLHGKASAVVDLDGDGFLDVIIANWADRLEVYRNDRGDRPDPNHWLQVDLVGDGMAVHPDAIGAVVEVGTPDGTVQTCWRTPKPSTSSTGDYACHFGLGPHEALTSVVVEWPDGERTAVDPLPAVNQRVVVEREAP